jgi:hypothetical protein
MTIKEWFIDLWEGIRIVLWFFCVLTFIGFMVRLSYEIAKFGWNLF